MHAYRQYRGFHPTGRIDYPDGNVEFSGHNRHAG